MWVLFVFTKAYIKVYKAKQMKATLLLKSARLKKDQEVWWRREKKV